MQHPAARRVEQHVVGDDRRYPRLRGEGRELVQARVVVRAAPQGQRQVGAVAERFAQAAQAACATCCPPANSRRRRSRP